MILWFWDGFFFNLPFFPLCESVILGSFSAFFLTIIPVSSIQTLNVTCGERTLSTPSRRWKLMTNNMRISRKLVVTSAEKDNNYERNHHITKSCPNSITPLRESSTRHKELCLWRNQCHAAGINPLFPFYTHFSSLFEVPKSTRPCRLWARGSQGLKCWISQATKWNVQKTQRAFGS